MRSLTLDVGASIRRKRDAAAGNALPQQTGGLHAACPVESAKQRKHRRPHLAQQVDQHRILCGPVAGVKIGRQQRDAANALRRRKSQTQRRVVVVSPRKDGKALKAQPIRAGKRLPGEGVGV